MNAYEQGIQAYHDGLEIEDCPYGPQNGENEWEWINGWLDSWEADDSF
jgi:ribosome modulation factor